MWDRRSLYVVCQLPPGTGSTAELHFMQSVFAALKKLGVADKDIQTANFSVSPQYANGTTTSRRI